MLFEEVLSCMLRTASPGGTCKELQIPQNCYCHTDVSRHDVRLCERTLQSGTCRLQVNFQTRCSHRDHPLLPRSLTHHLKSTIQIWRSRMILCWVRLGPAPVLGRVYTSTACAISHPKPLCRRYNFADGNGNRGRRSCQLCGRVLASAPCHGEPLLPHTTSRERA